MTHSEIMAMDGQALCRWLQDHYVFKNSSITDCCIFDDEVSKFNLPACAFAARDWCDKIGKGLDWFQVLSNTSEIMMFTTPIDWLRAAAIVIMEVGNAGSK